MAKRTTNTSAFLGATRSPAGESSLHASYDEIVREMYKASAGTVPWVEPLQHLADVSDAWGVQLLGVEKHTGTVTFSDEAGLASPEARLD